MIINVLLVLHSFDSSMAHELMVGYCGKPCLSSAVAARPLIASAYAHMEIWKKALTFHKRVKISSLRNRIGRMREWSPWSSGSDHLS